MQRILDKICSVPPDYKYTKIIDTPCYINTLVSSSNEQPYGIFDKYNNAENSYQWTYKLDRYDVSHHQAKVLSMVYDNGELSCQEKLKYRTNYSNLDSSVGCINYTAETEYVYNPKHTSTHYMIHVDMSNNLIPVILNDYGYNDISVELSYLDNSGNEIITQLRCNNDEVTSDNIDMPIYFNVSEFNNGFIIRFYNIDYTTKYNNYDLINRYQRNLKFNIKFSAKVLKELSEDDYIDVYECIPTELEDKDDTLFIKIDSMSEKEKELPHKQILSKLNPNISISVIQFYEDIDYLNPTYYKVLGYIYSDFMFSYRALSENYILLTNILHLDAQ